MAKRQETILQGPVLVLLGRLSEISETDATTEKSRSRAGCGGGLLCAAAFLLFFVGLGSNQPALSWLAGPLFAGAIFLFVVHSRLAARDLDNDRLALARELLQALRPDISEKSGVELIMRHGPWERFGKVTGRRSEGDWASAVQHSEYEDPWFVMRGRLTDGGAFRLAITTTAKRKSRQKRKYTKHSDRVRDSITLSLRVPEERYPHLEKLQAGLRPDQLRQSAGLSTNGLQVQGRTVRVTAVTGMRRCTTSRAGRTELGAKPGTRELVSLFAFVYAGLGGCRPPAAPAGS